MSQLDLLITALYFSVCCEKYSITKNTWDVIIMKNLNTNDSEFYCSPLVSGVACETYFCLIWVNPFNSAGKR